jgi:hypothetical protein
VRRLVPLLCGAAVLLTACSGKSDGALPGPPSPTLAAPSPRPLPTCAPARTKPYTWPKPVPADLPKIPGVVITGSKQTADGLTIVNFHTESSLRDGVIFIVQRLPPAGFTLGRGDAEATEADAPFTKGDLRGVIRGSARTLCQTDWILAVTRQVQGGTGSPLLPSHTGPSPTPLPFG